MASTILAITLICIVINSKILRVPFVVNYI